MLTARKQQAKESMKPQQLAIGDSQKKITKGYIGIGNLVSWTGEPERIKSYQNTNEYLRKYFLDVVWNDGEGWIKLVPRHSSLTF